MAQQKNGPPGLRPVVISQINDATQAHPDAEYFIENVEVKDVSHRGIWPAESPSTERMKA